MDKENIPMKWDFAQTRELASIFILLGALVALMVAGSLSGGHFMEMWRQIFSQAHLAQLSPEETEGLAILFFNNVYLYILFFITNIFIIYIYQYKYFTKIHIF